MLTNGADHSGDTGYTTLADGSRTPKDAVLLAAQGDLEEASMTIGAAVTVGYLPNEFDSLLRRMRQTLAALAHRIAEPSVQDQHGLDELNTICERYATETLPTDFAMSSGLSDTVTLLKLARTVTRRAERTLWTLFATEKERPARQAAVFVNRLADVLLLLAFRVDREVEQETPIGGCGTPDDIIPASS